MGTEIATGELEALLAMLETLEDEEIWLDTPMPT